MATALANASARSVKTPLLMREAVCPTCEWTHCLPYRPTAYGRAEAEQKLRKLHDRERGVDCEQLIIQT